MAGGEGTRLRPMTANQPKPLLPVANRPILEHVLRLLKRHGFTETVVTVDFRLAGAELLRRRRRRDEPQYATEMPRRPRAREERRGRAARRPSCHPGTR
jgi:NDP-sugar pyrophosphorylase family protein